MNGISIIRYAALGLVMSLGSFASAAAISVSVGTDEAGNIAPLEAAGVVSVQNWNNVAVQSTNVAVVNDLGALSGSLVSVTSTDNAFTVYGGPLVTGGLAGDQKLWGKTAYTAGNWPTSPPSVAPIVVTLTNVPYATYDVYFYANGNDQLADTFKMDVNGDTRNFLLMNRGFNGTYSQITPYVSGGPEPYYNQGNVPDPDVLGEGNYVKYAGVTGSTLTITLTGLFTFQKDGNGDPTNVIPGATPYSFISGFQVVESLPVPEPTFVGAGLGLAALVLRRRG